MSQNKLSLYVILLLMIMMIGISIFFAIKINKLHSENEALQQHINNMILEQNKKIQLLINDKQQHIIEIQTIIDNLKYKLANMNKPTYITLPDSLLTIEKQYEFIRKYENNVLY